MSVLGKVEIVVCGVLGDVEAWELARRAEQHAAWALTKVRAEMDARDYHQYKTVAMGAVLESHARLARQYDAVIVEGAGSPAEINLLDRDIVNLRIADEAQIPAVLVGDIDLGGVFASLYGTVALLPDALRARVRGFVYPRISFDLPVFDEVAIA